MANENEKLLFMRDALIGLLQSSFTKKERKETPTTSQKIVAPAQDESSKFFSQLEQLFASPLPCY